MDEKAYYFPHRGTPRMLAMRRDGAEGVVAKMPDGSEYYLGTADEVTNLFVIVEGDIPTGGLSSDVEVIRDQVLQERLVVPSDGAYTRRVGEEEPIHVVWRSRAYHTVRRYVILFSKISPYARILLRRYDQNTLRPNYVTLSLADITERDYRAGKISDFDVHPINIL